MRARKADEEIDGKGAGKAQLGGGAPALQAHPHAGAAAAGGGVTFMGSCFFLAMKLKLNIDIIKEGSTFVNPPYVVRCNLLFYDGLELSFPKQR